MRLSNKLLIIHNCMSKLPQVILLTNNKNKSSFYINLGEGEMVFVPSSSPLMCAAGHYTKKQYFRYEIFELDGDYDKVNEYIKSRDGIIILLDDNIKSISRVDYIINMIKNIPTLIFIEKHSFTSTLYDNSNNFSSLIAKIYNKYNKNNVYVIGYDYSQHKLYDNGGLLNKNGNDKNAKDFFTEKVKLYYENKINVSEQTSKTIDSDEMMMLFENNTMELKLWDHYGRLRMVYLSLHKKGYKDTINVDGWLCKNWRKYKTSIGHGDLWNYSLTRFWIEIIYGLMNKYKYKSFSELYNNNSFMHSGGLFKEYYDDIIFSMRARREWVEPNLKKINNIVHTTSSNI